MKSAPSPEIEADSQAAAPRARRRSTRAGVVGNGAARGKRGRGARNQTPADAPSGALPARRAALGILRRVLIDRRSLTRALAEYGPRIADQRERALARELAAGVVRRMPALRHVLDQLLDRPFHPRPSPLETILLLGLFQLLHTRIPAHAAVHETVRLVAGANRPARGLANAVLRRAAAERDALLAALDEVEDPTIRHAHPAWMVERLRADWPREWETTLAANNERAPMTLRAHRQSGGRERALERLREAGLDAAPHPLAPDALTLARPADVDALPGFADGALSVQDAAAQLAAPLLSIEPGMRVLDACAAPGGKTAQIADLEPGLAELVATDVDATQIARARANFERTGTRARLLEADASEPDAWWDGAPFDRILLDAPCSASGVIRRHPDIKYLRRADDVDALAARQRALLDAAWRMLAPGGRLVYAVCSVFAREGSEQITDFVARHADARPIPLNFGRPAGPGAQLLAGDQDMDGFFHACLLKHSS